jgi:hypothetical protein
MHAQDLSEFSFLRHYKGLIKVNWGTEIKIERTSLELKLSNMLYIFSLYSKKRDNLYISRSRVRLAAVKRLCLGGHVAWETRNTLGLSVGKSLGMTKEMEGRNKDES